MPQNHSQKMLMGIMTCSICHARVDHMKELKEVLMRVSTPDTKKPLFLGLCTLCPTCRSKYADETEHTVVMECVDYNRPKDFSVSNRNKFMNEISEIWEKHDETKKKRAEQHVLLDVDGDDTLETPAGDNIKK